MQGMKESAANVGASAKAGMEKTKATMQEKADKMSAHDPLQKEMATQKKEQRIAQAEFDKQEAREHNAAAKHAARAGADPQYTTGIGAGAGTGTGAYTAGTGTHTHSATGATGYPTGMQQGSALPGHGTGQTFGGAVEEGMGRTHPTGLPGDTTGHNVRGGRGYGPGGTYT